MDYFALAMQALNYAAATADAAAQARLLAGKLKEAAAQSGELTDEQSAELDAKAEAIFSSPASKPSGR